jgi:hypothetical protein
MRADPEKSQKQDSAIWVWDSTWSPAVAVNRARMGSVLVRLEHGVTFNVKMTNVAPRDRALRGRDIPVDRFEMRRRIAMGVWH